MDYHVIARPVCAVAIYNKEKENENILAIMNKTLTTAALPTLGASSYVSPEAKVTEIHTEGVLCASQVGSTLSIDDWENGSFSW